MPKRARRVGEFDYINDHYGLSLKRGLRVKVVDGGTAFNGRQGVVASGDGQYIMVRFDGDTCAIGPFHPTSGLEYEAEARRKRDG